MEVGQRVRFLRSHDKTVSLTGRIVKLHDDGRSVDIEVEPDGKIAEIATTETAHLDEVSLLDGETASTEESAESTETGEASDSAPRRRRR